MPLALPNTADSTPRCAKGIAALGDFGCVQHVGPRLRQHRCAELRRIQLATGWRDYRIEGTNMPTMDECRRKAEECLRWADEAAKDAQRETLLEIARL